MSFKSDSCTRAGWVHRSWRRTMAVTSSGAAAGVLLLAGGSMAYALTPLFPRASQVAAPSGASSSTPYASLYATACTSGGNCIAGGNYYDASNHTQAYVVRESHGNWSGAVKITLPKSALSNPDALVAGLGCVSAGNCFAVGSFEYDASQDTLPFIAKQVNGVWQRAFVPRLPASANHVNGQLNAVTCLHTGFCEAIGGYTDKSGHSQTMAVAKPAGHGWQQATEVLSPKGATADPKAYMTALACPAAGSCVAVGDYQVPTSAGKAMGAVESGGIWRRAVAVALPANAAANLTANLGGISCQGGTCTAVGDYYFAPAASRAMWVTEKNGHFGTGKEVITAPADASPVADTDFFSISCPQTGPCVAVGNYITKVGTTAALSMTLSAGKWTASTLLLPLNAEAAGQFAFAEAVSCTGAEHCTAVGDYRAADGIYRAMATTSN